LNTGQLKPKDCWRGKRGREFKDLRIGGPVFYRSGGQGGFREGGIGASGQVNSSKSEGLDVSTILNISADNGQLNDRRFNCDENTDRLRVGFIYKVSYL